MGRLTLNVLLSFAQFEREVISERVRDKIAASKAKGMWMGGIVPLGYDVKDRKLVANEIEAETVRSIMRRYLELGSVRQLMDDLRGRGIVTKRQRMRDGSIRGGVPFARGPLYHLLKNRTYVGETVHHHRSYPGEHAAIVDRSLFAAVQAKLADSAGDRRMRTTAAHPSLLAGRIRDSSDRPMSPSHAVKGRQRYRYYVSNAAVPAESEEADRIWRLPAIELEKAVTAAVAGLFHDPMCLVGNGDALDAASASRIMSRCHALGSSIPVASTPDRIALFDQLDVQVSVEPDGVQLSCSRIRLLGIVGCSAEFVQPSDRILVRVPTTMMPTGHGARHMFLPTEHHTHRDPRLIRLIANAFAARDQLTKDEDRSDPAALRELRRKARLAFLAPDIITAILDGRQPVELTTRRLLRLAALPLGWPEQRRVLGLTPSA
jgi:hypothetical protein